MSKQHSLSYLENYFKQELLCAKKVNSAQKIVELSECIHHLKNLSGVVDKIGVYPVVGREECNTWITGADNDEYVVNVSETTFNKMDIGDELVTGYDIEDGSEYNGKYYLLVKYVGE